VVKRGEDGAALFTKEGSFWAPAYPLEDTIDPTGAGDTFAGGFLGYIAECGGYDDPGVLRRAVLHGTVCASFSVERFSVDRFLAGAPFRPWLLRIVANEAINRRKARGRRPTVGLSMAMDRPSPDTALSPEGAALASERRERVLAALREMREEDRVVIAYRYFFDLSEAEMAQALDVARGTVKSRLSRAIARLREHMGEETAE